MRNETGRFDEEDLNKWKKPKDEPDPLSKVLLRSSENVQLGAIFGGIGGILLGALIGFIAYKWGERSLVCSAVTSPIWGILIGAVIGKTFDVYRALRRQARRAKKEQKEQARKEKDGKRRKRVED